MPLLKPIVKSSKETSEWLFSSDFPTPMTYLRASRAAARRKRLYRALEVSTVSEASHSHYSSHETSSQGPVSIEQEVDEVLTTNFFTRLKIQFLKAFPIDGHNTTTNKITCADGTVEDYDSNSLPFRFVLTSWLGLPNRPGSVINGVPQLSFLQFWRNCVGGWTRIRAESSNVRIQPISEIVSIVVPVEESQKKTQWTSKKIIQIIAIPFKILIALFKVVTLPFKILLNAVKLVTEFALPLISFYTAVLNIMMAQGIALLGGKAFEKEEAYELNQLDDTRSQDNARAWLQGEDGTRYEAHSVLNYSKLKIGLFIIGIIPMVAAVLSVLVFQYATVLLCRAGRALTSPAESARRAFALGRSLQIGKPGSWIQTIVSNTMGILGALVSLGVSALLWTLALPFALSTVTTWIPSLINAINWIAQLPAVSASLTWISSTSLVSGSMVLLNNLFATVGVALSTAFGPAITAMAGVISVQVPAVVLAVGTTLGMLAMPVAALLSLGADKLSNIWAEWTVESPFSKLFSVLSSLKSKPKLNTREGLTFTGVLYTYGPNTTLAPSVEHPPLETVVSPIALNLVKNQHLIERASYHANHAQQVFDLVSRQDPSKKLGFRFPTPDELSDREIQQAANPELYY